MSKTITAQKSWKNVNITATYKGGSVSTTRVSIGFEITPVTDGDEVDSRQWLYSYDTSSSSRYYQYIGYDVNRSSYNKNTCTIECWDSTTHNSSTKIAASNFTFTSSNTSIITVNSSGVVTYAGNGNAYVTVTAKSSSNYVGTKTCYFHCLKDTWDDWDGDMFKNAACTQDGYNVLTYGTPELDYADFSDHSDEFAVNGSNELYIGAYVDNEIEFYSKLDSGYLMHVRGYIFGGDVAFILDASYCEDPTADVPVDIDRFDVYQAEGSDTCVVSHSTMGTQLGYDCVAIKIANANELIDTGDTWNYITESFNSGNNRLTWGNVSLSVSSPATPYAMNKAGETKAISASSSTQTGTYTSGSTTTYSPTITYTVKTAKSGFSLSSNNVTVTNNTSTTARNGFVVTVTANGKTGTNTSWITGLNKTTTSDRTFNQAAGAIVWGNPDLDAWSYPLFSSSGGTYDSADLSASWTQNYTWNGVAGSGGTISDLSSGYTVTWAFTKTTLPSGCTAGSNFSTSGEITWSNNTSTSERSAASCISATITVNGKSSNSCSCYSCNQAAGAKVYSKPTVNTYAYDTYAAAGATKTPTVSYSMPYTWNGVSGSGGSDVTGGTLTFSKGTLTSGATAASNYSTTGTITWANNTTTSARSTHSVLTVTVKTPTGNLTSDSKTCTACTQSAGAKVYSKPTVNTFTYATYAAAGATKTPTVSYTLPYTWNGVSGTGGSETTGGTLTFSKGTLTSGATAGSSYATNGSITWANNTTTSTRSTHSVLTVTVTSPTGNQTSDAKTCTACTQSAGSKVYNNPTVTQFTYGQWNAVGYNADDGYPIVKYSQTYTWNGVSGSGATNTYTYDANHTNPGGSRSFTTTGTLPSGFSVDSTYSTTGKVSWTDRGYHIGSARDAASNLKVTVTVNGKTSSAYTCTSCAQEENKLEYLTIELEETEDIIDVTNSTYTMNYNDSFPITVIAHYTADGIQDVTSLVSISQNPTGIITITT